MDEPVVDSTPSPEPVNPAPWYEGVPGVTDKDMEYGSVEDYVKGTQSLRSLISKKGIIPPESTADDASRSAFLDSVKPYIPPDMLRGEVPTADAYDVALLKENEVIDDDRRGMIYDKFNKANLTNEQANSVMDLFAEQSAIDMEAIKTHNTQTIKQTEVELRGEWGDDYPDRAAAIDNVMKRHPQVAEKLASVGLAGDAEVMRMLDAVARATSEDSIQNNESARQSATSEYNAYVATDEYRSTFPGFVDANGRMPNHTPEQRQAILAKARALRARSMGK